VDLNAGASSAKKTEFDISFGQVQPNRLYLTPIHKTNITCRVTANLASSTDGSYLFGGKHGIGIAQRDSSEYRYIKRFWNDEEVAKGYENSLRANDGAVDSQGRFWVGTVNDPAVTGGKFDPVGMSE
jgi:sugar lactone lactonase YvrE